MLKRQEIGFKIGKQTFQILTNDDEVCIPSLSSILLAVKAVYSQSGDAGTDFRQNRPIVNSKAFTFVTK